MHHGHVIAVQQNITSVAVSGWVVLVLVLIMSIALILLLIDRRLAAKSGAFASLFMYHPDAVYALDLNGAITDVNPAALHLIGYTADDLVGIPFVSQVIAEERSRILYLMLRASRGDAQCYETMLTHRQGHTLIVSVTNVPIRVLDRVVGFYSLIKDITEHTRIEQERTRLIAILEATTDIVATAQPDGQLWYYNHAGQALLGWNAQEPASGRTLDEAFAPQARAFIRDHAMPITIRDGVWSGESVLLSADGREIPVSQVLLAHKDAEQTITFLSSISRDISERKQAEAALQAERSQLALRVAERTAELSAANIELARAARLKDEFLASVSHELRTPLNAILGLSEALKEEVYGKLCVEQTTALAGITESGQHLLSLINDILDLSKMEAGKVVLNYDVVAIPELCEASLRMVRQIAHQKELRISFTTDNLISSLDGDARRLKQLLVNLLSNAVKFTPAGGAIGLEITAFPDKQHVQFTVWDTGIGISPDNLARLFQPFVQLDSSLARQYNGTGLGLALVSSMVKLHGGNVSVESAVGHGSRFSVSLPYSASLDVDDPLLQPRQRLSDSAHNHV